MGPPPLDPRREWLSLEDEDGTWMFDATFLSSAWRCVFGEGCRGVLPEDATERSEGCCSHGAHFSDAADLRRVRAASRRLTARDWQFAAEGRRRSPFTRSAEGQWVTRVHEGACIFLNRPGFTGGVGCALHVLADRSSDSLVDVKPEVCWQLPLRLVHLAEEDGHSLWVLREWKRRDWGEAGTDFHWWCTEAPEAFTAAEPVYRSLAAEIAAMVGQDRYTWISTQLGQGGTARSLPFPVRRP